MEYSKITIIAAIFLAGMISSGSILYQQSQALNLNQSEQNSPKSMSVSAKLSPSLDPENITVSVGDLILTTTAKSTGLRIPDPGKPVMEVSWTGAGVYRGNTNVTDFGTAWIEFGADGISKSHGQGIILNQKGEVATYTFQGLGRMGADGLIHDHGTEFFSSSQVGEFASLSKVVGVYADQNDQKGNTVTKVWELKYSTTMQEGFRIPSYGNSTSLR